MNATLESALEFLTKYPNVHLFPAIWKDGRHIGYASGVRNPPMT